MINSKAKGKQGELEAVRLCKSEGFDCHRTAQYCGNAPEGSADIIEAERENRLGDECDVHDWLSLKEYIENYVTGVIDDDKQ